MPSPRLHRIAVLCIGMVGCTTSPPRTQAPPVEPKDDQTCAPRAGYRDQDRDGFGDLAEPATGCPPEVVSNADDCDDTDAAVAARTVFYADQDADGWGGSTATIACGTPPGFVARPGDCDDTTAEVHPGAAEWCNGRDEDCDGRIDDDDDDGVLDPATWYRDADADGHGDPATSTRTCEAPDGFVDDAGDCDDTDPGRAPSAPERCLDGTDDDCDGVVDEACPQLLDSADALVTGTTARDMLGAALQVGDWDGDGQPDLAIGAPGSDAAGEGTGAVYLLPAEEALLGGRIESLDTRRLSGGALDVAGFSLAPGSDIDADGFDDLLVSLVGGGEGLPGAVSLVWGPITAAAPLPDLEALRITGAADYDGLGAWGASVGDTRVPGSTELLVGIIGDDTGAADAGAAVLFSLPAAGALTPEDAMVRFQGSVDRGNLGMATLLADLDGDGASDVILGEPGAARVLAWSLTELPPFGTSLPAELAPTQLVDTDDTTELGAHIDAADLDGDGHLDLLIGSPAASDPYRRSGRWDVVRGPIQGSIALAARSVARFIDASGLQTSAGDAGSGVVLADLNGDGTTDLLLGSPGHWTDEVGAGGVFWFAGPLSGTVELEDAPRSILGTVVEEAAGDGLAVGDLDGDGLLDLVVGAPMDEDDYGRVGVFVGSRAAW